MPARPLHRPPKPFSVVRRRPAGKHRLLEVFPGLTEVPPFSNYPGDSETNRRLAESTYARIYDGLGYLYVAPREVPVEVRQAGFEMVTSPDEEIVVARHYLRKGAAIDLYLDVIHEFLHILQRKAGRELWPGPTVPYVDRPTEIEAYAFSVAEARRLGIPDSYLRKYLEVMWVSKADHRRLLRHLDIPEPRRPSRRPRRKARA